MNRIRRTSVDIKNFKEIAEPTSPSPDKQLLTLQRLEHLISSLKQIIKFLSETPLIYEMQRYHEPLTNLCALHKSLRSRYPSDPVTHAGLVDEGVLRLVQYTDLIPLGFYKEKSGGAVHGLQTIESRRKVLAYAKVLQDRSETVLELAGVAVP